MGLIRWLKIRKRNKIIKCDGEIYAIKQTPNEDGTYTVEFTFEKNGKFKKRVLKDIRPLEEGIVPPEEPNKAFQREDDADKEISWYQKGWVLEGEEE